MTAMVVLGALSSMSNGPLMMLLLIIICLILEHFKQWVKPLLVFMVFSCIVVGVISNRPFYHVIASYANPLGGAGWYRAKLIDLAIEHFDEWWLMGYGGRDQGWGPALGRDWTDITNQYIGSGVMYGVLGMLTLVGTLVTALVMIIRCYKIAKNPMFKSCFWTLGSLIVSFMIAFNAFALFAQSGTLFICILGIIGSVVGLVSLENHQRNIGILVNR